MDSIETTITKNHKQENFPVGSWLLSKKIRSKILIFYKFAKIYLEKFKKNPKIPKF